MPGIADVVPPCSPARWKVSNRPKCRIDVERFFHPDDPAVVSHVGGATHERPGMIVGVMGDAKNRKLAFKDLSRRDRSNVWRLIKWPIISHSYAA